MSRRLEPLFSEREGFRQTKTRIQKEYMDADLRNRLWNILILSYWRRMQTDFDRALVFEGIRHVPSETLTLLQALWHDYLKRPLDEMPGLWKDIIGEIREYYFGSKWYEVYDLIEFVLRRDTYGEDSSSHFVTSCNNILEQELSAYRFVGGVIAPITSREEILEIEQSLQTPLTPVTRHIERSIALFSDKKSPDYRNSIKESISAVEAICRLITKDPNATLGQALGVFDKKLPLHPALKGAFSKLYGYASSAEGIRHALLDEPKLDFEDAKFMLVSCSAFVNYLTAKSSKAGITLQQSGKHVNSRHSKSGDRTRSKI
jgi:hypothetical protein